MLPRTPVRATPAATQPGASAALKRLIQTDAMLSEEMRHLPEASPSLLAALNSESKADVGQELASLLQQIAGFWSAPSASGPSRTELFAVRLEQTICDEVLLKSHENDLSPDAAACVARTSGASSEDERRQIRVSTLSVQLSETTRMEIRGALVMSQQTGRTLLALPGSGLTEFASPQALCETLAQWLNDPELRRALLINADQCHQDAMFAVADDPDLFIEAFSAGDVQLQAISGNPYTQAVQRQIDKQQEDVRYVCGAGLTDIPELRARQIDGAIRMFRLFEPSAMLERREQTLAERQMRAALPHWVKIAPAADLDVLRQHMQRHDQARQALSSALNGAASAEQYAQLSLRTAIANDLGLDLAPERISLSTQRSLPLTGQRYTLTRTLPQLALYGLHTGDLTPGSAFLTQTAISIDGLPIGSAYASLTPAYIARTIEALDLRVKFIDYQRATYAKAGSQKLMAQLIGIQITESAYVAKMQGHITADDFTLINSLTGPTPAADDTGLTVQHVRLNGNTLARVLVLRKENVQGELQRLIMFASNAPRAQLFQSFDNETQLLHELVAWAAIPEMRDYLKAQLPADSRPSLSQTLEALVEKPHPEPDFVSLSTLHDYETAVQGLVSELVKVTLSNQQAHSPDWYIQASSAQRQKLLALEDAINGAIADYDAQAHTRVQDFEDYVHQRASEKICQLLGVSPGTVDPDHIVITSERETLTYTRMLRDGYDDSIGFLNPAADSVATFSGPEGVDLSALTPAVVAGSVRGQWLSDAYTSLVRRTLLDPASTGYAFRRQASTQITCLQMQAAALRSLLKGHLDPTQYHWLEIAINNAHRTDADTRARYPIYPLQLHIDKPFIASHLTLLDQLVVPDPNLTQIETVQGCFALLSNENRLAPLLYTPEAPDGVEFRVFSSFEESLSQPGMIDYYKDRCRIKARRILAFFLNDMKQGNANKRPVLTKDSIANFAQICFNRPIERKLRDVEDTTSGRQDMLSNLIWNSVDIIATALTLPFPPASFIVGVGLSLRDSFRAFQALSGESPEDATAFILASAMNMAGAAGDLTQGLKGFGGAIRKLAREAQPGTEPAALKTPLKRVRRQELYPLELQDEPLLIGRANANGQAEVYRNAGFEPDAAYPTGHYVVKDSNGIWQPLEQPLPAGTRAPNGISADRSVNISLQDLPRVSEGHAKGVSLGNGKHYIGLNGQVYQVNYDASLRCWHIVDPANPFAFFGRQPVRLNDQGQWQLLQRSRLQGGGDVEPSASRSAQDQASTGESSARHLYELPEPYRMHMDEIVTNSPIDPINAGLADFFEVHFAHIRERYTAMRQDLYREARTFFEQPPVLAPRPPLPAVDASTSVETFLETAFANSNGLVLGEAPTSVASKRLLITHMPTLARQRVQVIYIEHLFTDKHLRKLAKYRAKGATVRSGSHELKGHLRELNYGALDNRSRDHDYYHVIKQAHRHGIEVRPLNSSVSYPHMAHPIARGEDSAAAEKMSKYFGHLVISEDLAAAPSTRWVALVDQKLASTYQQLPGLAELQGAISVHIEDLPAGSAPRISMDTGLATAQREATMGDFKLEFASSANSTSSHAATPRPDAALPTAQAAQPLPTGAGAQGTSLGAQASDLGYRWDDAAGWQRIAPEAWIAEAPPTALQQSLIDASYEMPADTRHTLHYLAYVRRRGLDSDYFNAEEDLVTVEAKFFKLRSKLQTDARQIILGDLPPRPTMPAMEPQPSAPQFIEDLYQHTDGMVVGEFHASIASKKFIMENLPLLQQQNVKTLYMEHLLTDLHQLDLDRFVETGHMSKRLLDDIRTLDRGHLTDPKNRYTFEKLIIKAQQHGLEIRAIDCAASYHLRGIHKTLTTRQEMMNYFASRTIRRHQAIMGQHRWVALVGNSHSNTFAKIVPGIAELEGAIGLRVNDVAPGTSRGITLDEGEFVQLPMSRQGQTIRGDFRVEVEVPGVAAAVDAAPPLDTTLEQKLARPGLFLTELEQDNQRLIVHRGRDKAIHRTPVQRDAAGQYFVDRPSWTAVHLQPYDNLPALVSALEAMQMTRIG